MKSLRDVETPLANFFASGVLALGPQLGPVLWQLPERLALRPRAAERVLRAAASHDGRCRRLAGRHDDKLAEDRVADDMRGRRAGAPRARAAARELRHRRGPGALCRARRGASSSPTAPAAGPSCDDATSDFRYVRLHGETELYASGYTDESLDRWAETCRDWLDEGHDVHVYFDNDAKGHAPLRRSAARPAARAVHRRVSRRSARSDGGAARRGHPAYGVGTRTSDDGSQP